MLERAVAVTAAASCVTSSRWDTEDLTAWLQVPSGCLLLRGPGQLHHHSALSFLAQNQDANASFLFLFEAKIGEIHTPKSDTW